MHITHIILIIIYYATGSNAAIYANNAENTHKTHMQLCIRLNKLQVINCRCVKTSSNCKPLIIKKLNEKLPTSPLANMLWTNSFQETYRYSILSSRALNFIRTYSIKQSMSSVSRVTTGILSSANATDTLNYSVIKKTR